MFYKYKRLNLNNVPASTVRTDRCGANSRKGVAHADDVVPIHPIYCVRASLFLEIFSARANVLEAIVFRECSARLQVEEVDN